MVARIADKDLFEACRELFGNEIQLSLDFLHYLQPSGAKSAYRRKVKETHPDLFGSVGEAVRRGRTEQFQKLLASYEVVCDFFKLRESGLWTPSSASQKSSSPRPSPAPRPAARRPASQTSSARGYLPRRVLEIGLYLYYRDCIDFRLLMDALLWQRRQRPNLGDIALRWGWLKEGDVRHILQVRGAGRRFGERAVGLDFLTHRQLTTLLFYQRSQQKKLGRYFVENAILSHDEIETLVREQREHNRLFGKETMFFR